MSDNHELSAPPTQVGLARFKDSFLKMTFESSLWEGRRRVSGIDATFHGTVLQADRVGKPPATLLPADLDKQGRQARQLFYNAVEKRTLPVDRGVRIVPVKALADVQRDVDAAIENFNRVADAIAAQHASILEYNRTYWFNLCLVDSDDEAVSDISRADLNRSEMMYYNRIGCMIPKSPATLRAFYRAGYRFPEPTDIAQRFEQDSVREFLERANQAAVRYAEETVRMVVEEPTNRLITALRNLHTRLSCKKERQRLTPSSLAEVGDAVTLLLAYGDAISPRFRQEAEGLERHIKEITEKAEAAKDEGASYTDSIRSGSQVLLSAIDSLVEMAEQQGEKAEAMSRFGVAPRRLRF